MKTRRNPKTWLLMSVFFLAMGPAIVEAAVVYVDAVAIGSNNGSSWSNAYNELQDALAVAMSGDEIWVAQGTYKPTIGSDRSATFQLINGVGMYGGFAGGETVLSGDIGTVGNNSDNSYHVVTGSGTDATAVLDGFTITAGNANGSFPSFPYERRGGGMFNEGGSPTVTNCTFSGNSAIHGGGMFNWNSSSNPTLTNCTFSGNWATNGGAMFNLDSSPTFVNCTFSGNSAGYGGVMYNQSSSSPTVTNCTFSDNGAGSSGGGMYNQSSSNPTLTNCTFSGNFTGHSGGGMSNIGSSPTLTNCRFSGNSTNTVGGGMLNYYSSPTLANCTFIGNSANNNGGAMVNGYNSSPTVTNCTFIGNSAGDSGGGMRNFNISSPTLTNCILWGDSAPSGPEIFNDGTSSANVSYSDVEGGWSGSGTYNINDDPMFADADGRLLPGSPCIDAGDNFAVTVTTDLDGNPRIVGLAVDMGAFEAPLADPLQLLERLAQQVIDLNLQSGIENGLDAKLDGALKAIDDLNENNNVAAINTLQAFINAVEAQRGTKITEADADALIASAQEIIALLS